MLSRAAVLFSVTVNDAQRAGRGQLERHLSPDHMCLCDAAVVTPNPSVDTLHKVDKLTEHTPSQYNGPMVYRMDTKMDSVLRILMEQFPPKPELTSRPSIRRVTIQKCMGASMDEGP
ncbi:hypothetical protein F2P81_006503 [Scophthalmus maximus]|uniref:Uncharacterized protein n=1 Tax=Scophthalmus maximus TaxID=52904 RepID=A0A6A4T636_SCOMX|nr:hypothetical protein F2P81_006503 [Scophthalmus maximus]